LGSNLGEREENIAEALRRLSVGVNIERTSSLYETEPVGYKEQPWFLNAVCLGETKLKPQELLSFIKGIERRMGREEKVRWGPRIIDIDILFYDDLVLETPELTIPHPRLHQRRFVLVPLVELNPDFVHPILGLTMRELLKRARATEQVRRFKRESS